MDGGAEGISVRGDDATFLCGKLFKTISTLAIERAILVLLYFHIRRTAFCIPHPLQICHIRSGAPFVCKYYLTAIFLAIERLSL